MSIGQTQVRISPSLAEAWRIVLNTPPSVAEPEIEFEEGVDESEEADSPPESLEFATERSLLGFLSIESADSPLSLMLLNVARQRHPGRISNCFEIKHKFSTVAGCRRTDEHFLRDIHHTVSVESPYLYAVEQEGKRRIRVDRVVSGYTRSL